MEENEKTRTSTNTARRSRSNTETKAEILRTLSKNGQNPFAFESIEGIIEGINHEMCGGGQKRYGRGQNHSRDDRQQRGA